MQLWYDIWLWNKCHKQIQWQNYIWISEVIFSTRFLPTVLVSLTYYGFWFKVKNTLGFSGFPGFKIVSESTKQTKQEKSQHLWGEHNMFKNIKITKKLKTISKQGFISKYSSLRSKDKSCNTWTILYSEHAFVWLWRRTKVKFCKHLNTISTGRIKLSA